MLFDMKTAIGIYDTPTGIGITIAVPIQEAKAKIKRSREIFSPVAVFGGEVTPDHARKLGMELIAAANELQAQFN